MKKMLTGIAAVVLFSSCTQVAGWFGSDSDSSMVDNSSYAAFARDESITKENAYSDLFLDTNAVNVYIREKKLPDSIANRLNNFYRVRNYQYAWFASDGPTEQARGLWSLYASHEADSASSDSSSVLNEKMDSVLQSDSISIAADSGFAETELDLTHKLIQYALTHPEHITAQNLYYLVPAKKQDPMQLADSILNKQKDSALYASNKTYHVLKSQLSDYYNIAKQGGWDSIHSAKGLKKGVTSPEVGAIKKRLMASGDYHGDTTNVFNDSLVTAIKQYQQRHGFKTTGVLNDSLIHALNIPVEERIQQLLVNMNRSLWLPPQQDSSTIVVNIPSQMLYVYSDSGKVMEMPVIVGKEGDGTIMFSSSIDKIVFNPSWNIPESIVREEILPKMRSDATYLKKNNMEIVSEGDGVPVIRQLPGEENPLGEVKFLFPNVHSIYLHDTPGKTLFNKNDRTLSHGCIRVADAQKLAVYLLDEHPEWNEEKITSAMKGKDEQTIELKQDHPVSITYLTAWVDENGLVNFRNDVYGHDREAINRMFVHS